MSISARDHDQSTEKATPKSAAPKLLPCPFCGSDDVRASVQEAEEGEPYVWHVCQFCGCETTAFDGYAEATEAWNTRAGSWQPIESAPTDGSNFLSLNTRQMNLMAVTWFSRVHATFKATGGQAHYQFTHWMPLPAGPMARSGGQDGRSSDPGMNPSNLKAEGL